MIYETKFLRNMKLVFECNTIKDKNLIFITIMLIINLRNKKKDKKLGQNFHHKIIIKDKF